jgi:phosphate-selective porin OprO/OprP
MKAPASIRVAYLAIAAGAVLSLALSKRSCAQERDTTVINAISAGEADAEPKTRRLVKWNEFDGKYLTFRFGGGLLIDYATYSQDSASKEQVQLEPGGKIRDARILIGGRFKTKRRITYQAGFMYDAYNDEWFVRQSGLMIGIPEAYGNLFIGRSKEGASLNKMMTGYDGWTLERSTFSDAIPLLADGIKWLGYIPSRHLIYNVGVFTDWLSEKDTWSYFDQQVVGRVVWAPMVSDSSGTLLHIGMSLEIGKPDNGQRQLRSKPEVSHAPYIIDTGKFPSSRTTLFGPEVYYRRGSVLVGSEYYWEKNDSPTTGNPTFQGGDIALAWNLTGETRHYNTVGGYFKAVSPTETVFEGGPGALETVLRLSYSDLDGGTIHGGKFWRITPMLNWHMSEEVRLAFAYGYGKTDRFDLKGTMHIFQTRLQLYL